MNYKNLAFLLLLISSSLTYASADGWDSPSPDDSTGRFNLFIVIDMQEFFISSHSPQLQRNINDELQRAMERNDHIIFLEYDLDEGDIDTGLTHINLLETVQDYNQAYRIRKEEDSGYTALYEQFLENQDYSQIGTIRICGVKTSACVRSTVLDLLKNKETLSVAKLILLAHCCSDDVLALHRKNIQNLQQYHGLSIELDEDENWREIYDHQLQLTSESFNYWRNRPVDLSHLHLQGHTVRVLMVIDMQPTFYASLDRTLRTSILREILRARNENALIVFAEVFDRSMYFEPTDPRLLEGLANYPLVFRLAHQGETTVPLRSLLNELGSPFVQEMRVAGIYTERQIVNFIRPFLNQEVGDIFQITLLSHATASRSIPLHTHAIGRLARGPRPALAPFFSISPVHNWLGESGNSISSLGLGNFLNSPDIQSIEDNIIAFENSNLFHNSHHLINVLTRYYLHRGDIQGIQRMYEREALYPNFPIFIALREFFLSLRGAFFF